jgi:hypothetical protein
LALLRIVLPLHYGTMLMISTDRCRQLFLHQPVKTPSLFFCAQPFLTDFVVSHRVGTRSIARCL